MIHVNFTGYHTYTTDSVYQWDLNRSLEITGLTVADAPTLAFSNKNIKEAIIVLSQLVGDKIVCVVPNAILQFKHDIIVHVCVKDAAEYKAIEKIRIPVIARAMPADYVYSDNVPVITDLISNEVSQWLDDHPEATTTVQDGAITESKLSSEFLAAVKNQMVTPDQFRTPGDTDDTDSLERAFQEPFVFLPKRTYTVSRPLSVESDVIISDGAVIEGSVDGYLLRVQKLGNPSLLGTASEPNAGDYVFNSSEIPSLESGADLCIISSQIWNAARDYYKSGEFNSVGDNGRLERGLFSSYVNAKVYRVNFGRFFCTGLTVINNKLPEQVNDAWTVGGAVLLEGIARSSIMGITAISRGTHCMTFNRCYKINAVGINCRQIATENHGLDYGVMIANSQDITIDGQFYAYRHGLAIGGDGEALNIVNRRISANGIFDNEKDSEVDSLDAHGNAEFISFSGYTSTGVSIGGRNNVLANLHITDKVNGIGVHASEYLAGALIIDGCTIYSKDAYAITVRSTVTTGDKYKITISDSIIATTSSAAVGLFMFAGLNNVFSRDNVEVIISGTQWEHMTAFASLNTIYNARETGAITARVSNSALIAERFEGVSSVFQDAFYRGTAHVEFTGSNYSNALIAYPTESFSPDRPYIYRPRVRLRIVNPANDISTPVIAYVQTEYTREVRIICYTANGSSVTGSVDVEYELYY